MNSVARSTKTKSLESLNSFFLGVFVGFLITAFCGGFLPIIAYLVGGFFAGLIAGGGMGKGALAGFVGGAFGALVATTLLISGLVTLSGILGNLVGGSMSEGLGLAIRIVAILLNIFGIVVAAAGGLVGGLVRAIIETS
jgi:hypothetical protein